MAAQSESFDDNKLPLWQRRRFRILKKALIREDFQQALHGLRDEYRANNNFPTANCFKLLREHKIPGDCAPVIWAILDGADLTDDEIASLIKPPVSYISMSAEKMGPSVDPGKEYQYWSKQRDVLLAKGQELLGNETLLLEISAFTTKDELVDFIKQFYDSDLKPLLLDSDSPFITTELREGRVSAVSRSHQTDQIILKMYNDGMSPKEIAGRLPGTHEPSNISKRISRAKKRQ